MTSIRHKTIPEDQLLDAARDAILAVGWSRTTLTDVARRAGVSRMTIYRRWPDTQSLLADLMTREWSTLLAVGESEDPLVGLVDGIVATVGAARENELLRRIADVDPEMLLPYLLDRRGRSQDQVLDVLEVEIKDGQKDGAIRRGKPATLARAVLLATHGFVLSAHTMLDGEKPRGSDVSAFDTELRELLTRYLRP